MVLSSLLEPVSDSVEGVGHSLKGLGKSDVEPIALVEQPPRDDNREAEASNVLRERDYLHHDRPRCPTIAFRGEGLNLTIPFFLRSFGDPLGFAVAGL